MSSLYKDCYYYSLCSSNDSPLLLLFIPSSGGAPFNDPSPLLPRDGAPLRDDSPPADLDAENKKQLSVLGISF